MSMWKLVCAVVAGLALVADLQADVQPVPDPSYVLPAPSAAPVVGAPIVMYSNVRYRAERNIAPCAVSKIVSVADPCNPGCCVNVEICVPPCECECVKVSKCGTKVKYDYGKYAVDITSRRTGAIVVSYHD
jgi:hypothetical protein